MGQRRTSNRVQKQSQKQERRRTQARALTDLRRLGLVELDEIEDQVPHAGSAEAGWQDYDDLAAFDDAPLSEEEADDTSAGLGSDAESDDETDGPGERSAGSLVRPQHSLHQLFGVRPPRIILKLTHSGDVCQSVPLFRPTSKEAHDALQHLSRFLEHIFAQRPNTFSQEDWHSLLWGANVSVLKRLVLLTRLAMSPNTRSPDDSGIISGWSTGYTGKLAALPDGTPFALRLLLRDDRGSKPRTDSESNRLFVKLPDAVRLVALDGVLRQERKDGKASRDAEIGIAVAKALHEIGLPFRQPISDRAIARYRYNLSRSGRGKLFPNSQVRQRVYDLDSREEAR